ncbi:MerR family transcriptional regulator [Bacillaceae bacterium SIJ1]|uniref:MerR family transcriptional regulator n=1 Tax=Litoribacterium kuwaitense TaxID=1398745 RepID=UPI0013ED6A29|nr:MerR family transcriptional regulator [Litoribacterium kuwaitense]NGP46289.1 MerR family transcriptional regulator [Litoribacterium kuwaitense]
MEYTVKMLAKMAGVSTRTLRYYDEIDLLRPARVNASGYRIYGTEQVDRLQQILFYKELGVDLEHIKRIVTDPSFNALHALHEHKKHLQQKHDRLNALLASVQQAIDLTERGIPMEDQEKFAAFKHEQITENERLYGKELREAYGEKTIKASNKLFKSMTIEQYDAFKRLEQEVLDTLQEAYQTGDPTSAAAQKTAALHKEWLSYTWPTYSPEAHAGLVQMYVDDPRFSAYYDKHQPGTAAFLRDAVLFFTGQNDS